MTRILVFSDSHGMVDEMFKIIRNMPNVAGIIHLGDIHKDVIALEDEFFEIPIYFVQGNNDYRYSFPTERLLKIDEKNIFITHGHTYSIGTTQMQNSEKGKQADLILYGHTHIAEKTTLENKIIANPGSISRPKFNGCSYGIIEIDDGILRYENIFL